MDIRYSKSLNSLTIYIFGELDEHFSNTNRSVVDDLIDKQGSLDKVIFDLSGLTFMDSTGIGFLIGRYKKLNKLKVPSYIKGAGFSVEKVIDLSGLYSIMPKI